MKTAAKGIGAFLDRLPLPRSLMLGLLVTVGVLGALTAVTTAARRGDADRVPTGTRSPAAVTLAGTSDRLPEAMRRVPTGAEELIRAAALARRDGFPLLTWDITKFALGSKGRMTYTGDARTLTGVDISEHQGTINWKAVAADGIDFAMIRVGYRGSTEGRLYLDEGFEKNISGALAAGLPVGVYFYSQAVSVEEAKAEADFVLEHIKGYDVTLPVVFDWEIVGGEEARTYTLSRRELCACTRAFCDRISEAGYDPMIYFTQYLAYRKYILRALADYGFWYAQYEPMPHIAFDFDMWQYSESGAVAGITDGVDLNILFVRDK